MAPSLMETVEPKPSTTHHSLTAVLELVLFCPLFFASAVQLLWETQ